MCSSSSSCCNVFIVIISLLFSCESLGFSPWSCDPLFIATSAPGPGTATGRSGWCLARGGSGRTFTAFGHSLVINDSLEPADQVAVELLLPTAPLEEDSVEHSSRICRLAGCFVTTTTTAPLPSLFGLGATGGGILVSVTVYTSSSCPKSGSLSPSRLGRLLCLVLLLKYL